MSGGRRREECRRCFRVEDIRSKLNICVECMSEIAYYGQRQKFYPSIHRVEDIAAMSPEQRKSFWAAIRERVIYEASASTTARWLGLKDTELAGVPEPAVISAAIAILGIYGWLHARREAGPYEFSEEPFIRAVRRVYQEHPTRRSPSRRSD